MAKIETVAELIERGATIRWRCVVCNAHGTADLPAILAAKGDDFTLANKRPPCRLCPGRVTFIDASSMYPRHLDTINDRDDAWWALNDAERARLYAMGWKVLDGKWVKPG